MAVTAGVPLAGADPAHRVTAGVRRAPVICNTCKKPLGSEVYRVRRSTGTVTRSGMPSGYYLKHPSFKSYIAHVCGQCVRPSDSRDGSKVLTCQGCGFRVTCCLPIGTRPYQDGEHKRGWFCSWHCRRSAQARDARKGLHCLQCEAALDPKRSDQRYCSARCKQKAYRERSKGA